MNEREAIANNTIRPNVTLIITRVYGYSGGHLADFDILIDSKCVGAIHEGSTRSIYITQGHHLLELRMFPFRSNRFYIDAKPDSTLNFICVIQRKGPIMMFCGPRSQIELYEGTTLPPVKWSWKPFGFVAINVRVLLVVFAAVPVIVYTRVNSLLLSVAMAVLIVVLIIMPLPDKIQSRRRSSSARMDNSVTGVLRISTIKRLLIVNGVLILIALIDGGLVIYNIRHGGVNGRYYNDYLDWIEVAFFPLWITASIMLDVQISRWRKAQRIHAQSSGSAQPPPAVGSDPPVVQASPQLSPSGTLLLPTGTNQPSGAYPEQLLPTQTPPEDHPAESDQQRYNSPRGDTTNEDPNN